MFATSTNEIPIAQSFLYLYLPTIIALLYSIFWSWIDLQIKRLEPYFQLSKPGGASGKDSLLLQYPFDFIPFVPITAIKNRHWAVFWASTAIVIVTWLLVPLQAAIFASESISRMADTSFDLSTDYVPAREQNQTLTSRYIQSAHGIIWLNETLPPYMSREYALTPFQPQQPLKSQLNETWTAATTLFSVDLNCETPQQKIIKVIGNSPEEYFNSSIGCEWPVRTQLGNGTIGDDSGNVDSMYKYKEFSSSFMGYYITDYMRMSSSYSLEGNGYCNEEAVNATIGNRPFLAFFTRNKQHPEDPPSNVTQLICTPSYYFQDVDATVDAKTKIPLNVTTKGSKRKLPADMWDASFFEYQMNRGEAHKEQRRGVLPIRRWPDQIELTSKTQLSSYDNHDALHPMAGLAFGAGNHTLEDLLDPTALKESYERAYRVIFSRIMVEILDQKFAKTQPVSGNKMYTTGVVILVPTFTYIVEGLLGLISICAVALMIISMKRKWSLRSDPATISSVMSLVADNPELLEKFSHLDCETAEEFEQYLKDKNFRLDYDEHGTCIVQVDVNSQPFVRTDSDVVRIPKPVRPREFRSFMAAPFIMTHIALAITLGVLLAKSRQHYGFARPSNNAIVRQIVENYIPTALATLIEPIWILINRLLCMLQPIEELQGGRAASKNSIDADYNSLPPQLVIFKALRSSHFKLAAVCLMALLANVLAVAFAGMFNEQAIFIPRTIDMYPPFSTKFVAINGSVGPHIDNSLASEGLKPSGAYIGGDGTDLFLAADSNSTALTPLPAWVDKEFMYIPFTDSNTVSNTEGLEARTQAFGATLDCKEIPAEDYFAEALVIDFKRKLASNSTFRVTMNDGTGHRVTCGLNGSSVPQEGPVGEPDGAGLYLPCQSGKSAIELVLALQANQSASQADKDFCRRTRFLGYARHVGETCYNTISFNASNALFIGCRPHLQTSTADVFVNAEGRVQNVSRGDVTSDLSKEFLDQHFSNDVANLLEQADRYIYRFRGGIWHNDSYASDMVNYFILNPHNDSRLLDPTLPVPSLKDVTQRLYPTYSSLFAIWLGLNKEKLLIPNVQGSVSPTTGRTSESHIRIFLSMPLFIIAEVILGIYAIVAFCIYFRRPGRFLPRMPTSISAIIALFAASSAVLDMEYTSHFTRRERRKHLESLGHTYGYGTFVGTDGNLHIGVEKEPLVKSQPVPGVLKKVTTGLTKTPTGLSGFSKKRSRFARQNTM